MLGSLTMDTNTSLDFDYPVPNTFPLMQSMIEIIPVPASTNMAEWEAICSKLFKVDTFASRNQNVIKEYEALDRLFEELRFEIDDPEITAQAYQSAVSLLMHYLYFYLPRKLNGKHVEPCKPVYSPHHRGPVDWV